MQWEGPFKERWFPILVNTKKAGLASVHFTWAGPEMLAVLRVLAPGVVLMLLDHDTLFTARWEAEELRRFAVLDLLPNTLSTESLGSMEVETDETQPCGSLPASPWSCSPDGSIPCGARSPNSIGMVCASEDQLEANGGLVIFYPNAPDGKTPQPPRFCIPSNVASAVTSIGAALSRALQLVIMPSEVPTPLPGMHEQVPLDQIHFRQCLRNTPLAGTTAHKHSDFVFAWALLGRYIHEVAWKAADLNTGRPEPDIQFGASPVRQVRGVKTWGQGPYEQGFLPLLRGYGGLHSRLAILPGPDLFMANRYAEVIPPPFVHGYGAKGKHILPQWGSVLRLPTLPESVWGNGDTVPLWASVGKKGSGPVRLQLFPGVLMFWRKDALSSCRATPKGRSRPNTPTGPLALRAAAAHAWLAQVDLPWPLFAADIKVTPLGLSQYWDDGLAMRVQQALAAFAFPAYQYPPPKPHLTPSGECRSLFISGMHGKAENAPSTVSGSIIHTANSYALTGLEMETVRDNQGKKVRYDDTQRPLLLSTSGNAAHALLLLPQAAQLWARALYPQVEGCGLPAAVRARISSVEASLTMCPALAHLHMPHTAALTALHVGLAAGRAGECKLCVTGFSAGSYTGAAVAIAWHERQKLPDCKGDFVHIKARLGGIAMPRAMLQYILGSELRHAVSLVHHESDQLCIFRPSQAARMQAIGAGARLYYFTGPESLGSGGHSYGHFVQSEELFQLTPGDYVHKELTKKICGLADPRMDRTVRAGLMGVACGSVQLSDKSKAFINSVLGRQIKRSDLEAFLRIPSAENRSIASLRTQVLLTDAKPHLADLPPPYHELGPTMKLVLGMWLPHLSLERLVDMLGYQFLAMASEAEIEEEPSEQYHYPEQAAVKRAATPVAIKPGTHAWPICLLHRVHPRASVMLLTPELADVPDWATKWFAVAGKVPAKGTALLVTLREDKGDVAYPGMFIELQAPKKLSTGPGESKDMQPVNITIALLLTDEQHNQFAQRPSLPRVSQLEVLPGGASTPLWDALLHMPRERQHVALGVPLEDSPLDAIRLPHWLPGFLTDLVLVLVIGLVVRGNWHDAWAQLIHPEVCQVFRGKHATQAAQASPTAGPGASNTLQNFLNLWLAEEQTYRKEWTPTLLSGVLATLPDSPLPGQEDARTPALWHAERLRLSHDSLSSEHDPRTRASIFALAVGPAFLTCLCDTFWGADGHLAALLGACSYGLAANRTSVFITGAPGSGKTRSCAFLGVLLACLTNRLTLYTAHGNESVRAYVEAVDRLTTASNEFVRSRIVRIPGNKEKDTHKLPFDVHDLYRGLLVATTHGTIVARLSFPYSQLTNRLKDVELLLRDEAQQLGTPGSNTVLAHIKHALDVMIGDHRQPAGGSRPNYHFVTELLEQKICGLNAVPADLHTPATLPAALLQQVAQSSGPWKKGQGEMPSWGNPHRSSGASEVLFSAVSMLDSILCMSIVKPKQAETVMPPS